MANTDIAVYAPPISRDVSITVNGESYTLTKISESNDSWEIQQPYNTAKYSISGNIVVWLVEPYANQILQYNGVDVLPTDTFTEGQSFTTRSGGTSMNFKHFYDAGLQGTGTIKFRHYSQTEPSSGETWVLNDTLAKPSWTGMPINFTSNNLSFNRLLVTMGNDDDMLVYSIDNAVGAKEVYFWETNSWTNTAYKTVTFATAPTGDLLTWLQANGTKQGGGHVVPNPNVERYISGGLGTGQELVALSDWTFDSSTQQIVLNLWNNYATIQYSQFLQDFDQEKTSTVSGDSGTAYLSEYDKLSADRSMVAIKENGNYTIDGAGEYKYEATSPQLGDVDATDNLDVLGCFVDVPTSKVTFVKGESFDKATQSITLESGLGIAFILYRFYKPVTVGDEDVPDTFNFIETPDLDSADAENAQGYVSQGGVYNGEMLFTSNGEEFYDIYIDYSAGEVRYAKGDGDDTVVYTVDNGWVSAEYRKVVFTSTPNTYNYFAYKWLFTDGNWVKQETTTTHTLTATSPAKGDNTKCAKVSLYSN